MTNKQLIKQEIEKQIDYAEDDTRYTESYREGLITAYQTIKAFIDSLPEESGCEVNFTTKNEDLEEELRKILDKHYYFSDEDDELRSIPELAKYIAHHFAEWQKQKDFEELLKSDMSKFKECYEKGRFDMREEMMKDAVLKTKVMIDCDGDDIETPYEEWLTLENTEIPYIPDNLGLKEGDRVKIIIVKTE